MILLYIFLIGCFITGIVALGVIFALAVRVRLLAMHVVDSHLHLAFAESRR